MYLALGKSQNASYQEHLIILELNNITIKI